MTTIFVVTRRLGYEIDSSLQKGCIISRILIKYTLNIFILYSTLLHYVGFFYLKNCLI
jgi:hypothetical protein